MSDEYSEIASAYNIEKDPAAEWAATWERNLSHIDPFEVWLDKRKRGRVSERTLGNYATALKRWKAFMEEQGRHPAFPSPEMVREYGRRLYDEHPDWSQEYRKGQLRKIAGAYHYFQENENFPHKLDFDPFKSAKKDLPWYSQGSNVKSIHRLSVAEVGEHIRAEPHVLHRAVVMVGLKMGLRAGEIANIRLPEVHIDNTEALDYYDTMGTDYVLDNRNRTNALYVPPDRQGNKSEAPKVIPIDDELRRVLLRYLLIRPDAPHDYLFVGKSEQNGLHTEMVNGVWRDMFAEYGETERHRPITSHFGRHFLNTYLRDNKEWDRDKIKYLRGDKRGHGGMEKAKAEALDRYIHMDYESIEGQYRRDIFKFGV